MRVMILSGSLRRASGTRVALQIAANVLQGAGVEVDFYDLAEHRLPLYDPDANPMPPEALDLRSRALAADAFLIGSPEYHSGMSGALKNAIDYLGSRQIKNKPVGLLVCAGAARAASMPSTIFARSSAVSWDLRYRSRWWWTKTTSTAPCS